MVSSFGHILPSRLMPRGNVAESQIAIGLKPES
jgi:hypothetical protein